MNDTETKLSEGGAKERKHELVDKPECFYFSRLLGLTVHLLGFFELDELVWCDFLNFENSAHDLRSIFLKIEAAIGIETLEKHLVFLDAVIKQPLQVGALLQERM